MGPEQDLVLIDTNIFVIDLRYKRDPNYKINRTFLDHIKQKGKGFTTIVNLLELCGILSFNLNEKQLIELWIYFQDRYGVVVLPSPSLEANFPTIKLEIIFDLIKSRTSLGDAFMVSVAKKHLGFVSKLISWDDSYFHNIFPGTVLTPEKYLKGF